MSQPGLTVPVPQFPVIGNSIPVAVMFMLHITLAEYSAGAIAIAPCMELYGVRRGDPRALRYAKALTTSYYLVFSLGATLAVFAVIFLIGLWGHAFGNIVNVFLPLVGVLFGLFLLLTPLLVVYKNTFGRMPAGPHIVIGFAVAILQNLFVVGITAVDTYLITPDHAGLLGGALNPPYLPLVVHRLVGNVSWTALLLAAYAVIRLTRAATEGDRLFQAWAARLNLRLGLVTAMLMPVAGFVLVEVLKQSQRGYFDNLVAGQAAWLFVVQEGLFAGVVLGGNLALALESRGRPDLVGHAALGLSALGMALGVLPEQVYSGDSYWLRYIGIGTATLVTLLHIAWRSVPRRTIPRLAMAPAPGAAMALPYTASALARRAVVAAGALSLAVSLWMGYMKEEARGDYSIYGELTQAQGTGPFQPPQQLYP